MTDQSQSIAIIGAGAAGLMAAEVLSDRGLRVHVYEQMPTAGRKILMAGKTGLNISHDEPLPTFMSRYMPKKRLAYCVEQFSANDIREWMQGLGIDSYVGSSGRIFPVQMKASGLLRAWLERLQKQGVSFHYRHRCMNVVGNEIELVELDKQGNCIRRFFCKFDAIILACGGGSYARLGSDGAWQNWFDDDELAPLYASNVGIVRSWSPFMQGVLGQPLKRVTAKVGDVHAHGDIIISHYGMESGLIYKLNHVMRKQIIHHGKACLWLDLLPAKPLDELTKSIRHAKKSSLNNALRKIGLDAVKIALLRECTDKTDWSDFYKMASFVKNLPVAFDGFRPIDEAISTGGGVKFSAVSQQLQSKSNQHVFIAGEMLDWDAPTGGYLLTACLAMGRVVADGVLTFLDQ
ncbi:TIGR03862 family flavoprotein [Moraxella oculi]|uniref:TIGR03862 family flavoprotein n=1 Tax=Moraxella oculi TaxID=2940516 RepID=A0ABW8U3U8_9GAMM